MRVNIILACTECKRRNYSTRKNKKNTTGRPQGGAPLPPDGTQGSSSNG